MKIVPEYALDANVILRYLIRDDEELYSKAQSVFAAIDSGDICGRVDPVNLGEVVWVMQSYYKLAPADIAPALEAMLRSPFIEVTQKDQYIAALRLYAGGMHHFGDACACAAAIDRCDGRLVSFDRKLSRIPNLQRIESL